MQEAKKCTIDCASFHPVEVKSDDDALDERLPNQIVDAILAFAFVLSILLLDRIHSKKARGLGKLLPATIICYTGVDGQFKVVSKFGRLVPTGAFNLRRTSLERARKHRRQDRSVGAHTAEIHIQPDLH